MDCTQQICPWRFVAALLGRIPVLSRLSQASVMRRIACSTVVDHLKARHLAGVAARAGQTDGHHGDAVAAQSNGRAWAG
ncbi:MAG: hypothetical protein INF50_05005 [Rhodobacter sp.]|nr:hypothetical protein [Rhodobacter sp.]